MRSELRTLATVKRYDEDFDDPIESHREAKKRLREYLRDHRGLRQKLEDCFRPWQIVLIKKVIDAIEEKEELWEISRRERTEKNLLEKEDMIVQLAELLEGAPIDELPTDPDPRLLYGFELRLILTIVNSERSMRSCRKVLAQIREDAKTDPESIKSDEVFVDLQWLNRKMGLGLNIPPLPIGNPNWPTKEEAETFRLKRRARMIREGTIYSNLSQIPPDVREKIRDLPLRIREKMKILKKEKTYE